MQKMMDWSNILSTPLAKLSKDTLQSVRIHLPGLNVNDLSVEELKAFFELSRHIIITIDPVNEHDNSADTAIPTVTKAQQKNKSKIDTSLENENFLKNCDIEESYYIQTIQELNREIAQNTYNKTYVDAEADGDSSQLMGIDTTKNLLYKIHIKNKYIKRLLCENSVLKEENNRQTEQILLLNVNLKQTAHKLTKAIGEMFDQKRQNRLSTDDIAHLHTKIANVRKQMARIERDKRKYKHNIVYLGEEIQNKILQWNDVLKIRHANISATETAPTSIKDGRCNGRSVTEVDRNSEKEENRKEIIVLSHALQKRNIIIADMEILLTNLTMEVSNSAIVLKKIVKNLMEKENTLAVNLEKLHNHLAKLLIKSSHCVIEMETQTLPVSKVESSGVEFCKSEMR